MNSFQKVEVLEPMQIGGGKSYDNVRGAGATHDLPELVEYSVH